MNDKKISFIYCVNDMPQFEESVRYVEDLNVPAGYTIDFIKIEGAENICSGYNQAMTQTDAKYKVYLHQDVYIINKNFINDILELFNKNKNIGLIGMVGAKNLPTNGIWWEAHRKFGKVFDSHTGEMELLSFEEVDGSYESVQVIDGLIMATQYDTPWREDIFNGWHFYDSSQSLEFLKRGYEVAVPRQSDPWCIHDCDIVNVRNGYDIYRNVFLDEYSTYLFPLVSILIPTYNRPEYLREALESVLIQTYRNIEIIICDDSTDNETKIMIEPYLKANNKIKYFKNQQKLGEGNGLKNAKKCLSLSSGEFINFLMDDDRFSSEKILKMVNYFLQYRDISLVTSYRQLIDKEGNFLHSIEATKKQFEKDTLVDGRELGKYVISNMLNMVGEPTTVLFRKNDLDEMFGKYLGRQYSPLSDVSTWLHLLRKGKAVYIAEPLSYFRLHEDQNANSLQNIITGAIEWFYLIKESYDSTNYVDNLNDLHNTLSVWLEKNHSIIKQVKQFIFDRIFINEIGNLINELYSCYKECLKIIFRENFNSSKLTNKPLVSVIVPAYNHEKYVQNTLDSIINQTYSNIELIILNDGSSDNTHKIITAYAEKLKNRFTNYVYINKENEGVCKTLNKGLEISQGKYIIPFASDDYMFPERIEEQVHFLEENKEYGMVYTNGFDYNSHDLLGPHCNYDIQNLFSSQMIFKYGDLFEYFLENVFSVPTPTVCIRRACYEEIGMYDENLIYEDPDMFLRISQKFKIGYIDKILTIHRIHGANAGKDAGVLIAGMILMEEKWRNINFTDSDKKKIWMDYLYKLKSFDYLKGKEFYQKGKYVEAAFHYKIALEGFGKLVDFKKDVKKVSYIKSAVYLNDLVDNYCSSLMNLKKYREAAKVLNEYTEYLDFTPRLKEIQNVVNEKKDVQKLKVVFLVQLPSIWPSTESVWKAFKDDNRCEVQIVQLPFYHHNYDDKINKNIGSYLFQKNIPFTYWYDYKLENEKPDVVFFQNPYDSTRPVEYSFERVSKIVRRTVYIHYCLDMLGGEVLDYQFKLPTAVHSWKVFVRSEKYRDMFEKYAPNRGSHIVVTGHPKMDILFNLESTIVNKELEEQIKNRKVFLWNPHHTLGENEWSTFIKWQELLLNLAEKSADMFLIIRPHPLLFGNLKRYFGNEFVSTFISKVTSMENVMLDLSDDYKEVFKISDALISDASSLLLEYLPTKKPIMYLPKKNGVGLNDDGDVVNYFYKGLEEKDIDNFINLILNNEDPMYHERTSQIEKYLFKFDGKAGYRIKENVISSIDAEEEI
ncbi:glycosyltransferase [Metabacillus fastidiosus]|uniref:glycosyltransferase n=1 Tax=Metabacillus fastidiosus TaxID=1458 RepID=UPI003D2B2212